MPISRWALAPVFQLLDIRREPGLSPFGYQFVSIEDIIQMCLDTGWQRWQPVLRVVFATIL